MIDEEVNNLRERSCKIQGMLGGEDLGNAVGEVVSVYRLCLSTPVG